MQETTPFMVGEMMTPSTAVAVTIPFTAEAVMTEWKQGKEMILSLFPKATKVL